METQVRFCGLKGLAGDFQVTLVTTLNIVTMFNGQKSNSGEHARIVTICVRSLNCKNILTNSDSQYAITTQHNINAVDALPETSRVVQEDRQKTRFDMFQSRVRFSINGNETSRD
jgi:hypothetical protein